MTMVGHLNGIEESNIVAEVHLDLILLVDQSVLVKSMFSRDHVAHILNIVDL